jgi:hypothetical protein
MNCFIKISFMLLGMPHIKNNMVTSENDTMLFAGIKPKISRSFDNTSDMMVKRLIGKIDIIQSKLLFPLFNYEILTI